VDWELKFPLVSVRALTRTGSGSDHAPLLLDSGIKAHVGNQPRFSFELFWLSQDGFIDMVAAEWKAISVGNSPIERWQNKIRHLHHFLKGWAKNMSGKYRLEKERLTVFIDSLDIKAETLPLSPIERDALKDANSRLARLRCDEE
jgi:hypothetical protein